MNILIACEESQAICIEMRKLGHIAFSCDILECSGGHPEWHIQGDCLPIINGRCAFATMDGTEHSIDCTWDLLIAHPPCTYLTVTGNRWFNTEKYGDRAKNRERERDNAKKFFMEFINADCAKIAVENPIGIMSTEYRKADQIIQPYMFGDAFEKKTCLWLKGLNKLIPTDIVEPEQRVTFASGKSIPAWYVEAAKLKGAERAKVRSKTFPGIAKAIAEQWAGKIN